MSSPYPTAYQIEEVFTNRGHPEIFNSYLADTADVLVMGGEDFRLGGRYNSVQSFHDEIYGHVTSAFVAGGIQAVLGSISNGAGTMV